MLYYKSMLQARISLANLKFNLKQIKSAVSPKTEIMAIVKANAYGHGMEIVTKALIQGGINNFGVARFNEALKLRALNKKITILILSPIEPEEYESAIKNSISMTVSDLGEFKKIIKTATKIKTKAIIHLKVDTGLHRSGCSIKDALRVAKILNHRMIVFEGLFTHFANVSDDKKYTQGQLDKFNQIIKQLEDNHCLPPMIHMANSAATLSLPKSHFKMVRVGLALHGLNPFHPQKYPVKLKPTLSVTAEITRIQTLNKGELVGYGGTFQAKRQMCIATINAGYGDGLRRAPISWPYVEINNQKADVIGRVSMDQITVDISKIKPVPKLHQKVNIIKNQVGYVEKLADKIGTSNYELVTLLSARINRVVK